MSDVASCLLCIGEGQSDGDELLHTLGKDSNHLLVLVLPFNVSVLGLAGRLVIWVGDASYAFHFEFFIAIC